MATKSRTLGSAALWIDLEDADVGGATLKGPSSSYELNVLSPKFLEQMVAEAIANPGGVGLYTLSGTAGEARYVIFRNLLVLDHVTPDRTESVVRELIDARAIKELSFDVEDEQDRSSMTEASATKPVTVTLTTNEDGAAKGTLTFLGGDYHLQFHTPESLFRAVEASLAERGYFLGTNLFVQTEITPKTAKAAVTDVVRNDMLPWLAMPPDEHLYGDDIELAPTATD